MKLKLSEILGNAQKVIIKYPMTLLMSAVMTTAAIYLNESYYENKDINYIITKILSVSALGISLSFALKMLTQRTRKFFWLEFLLIPFLIAYYFVFPTKEDDFTEIYTFVLIPSYLLAHLLVAFIPYLKRDETEANFWEYNKNLFVNFFLTVVFAGVLCGGVELAISAMDNLFNLDIDSDWYINTYFFFLIFGSTFIFLLFNIGGLESLEKKTDYPVVLKFFTQFILIPLLIIYAVILYLYSFKILISWELPRGWVSYLILAYSMLGILALLLVHPLKDEIEKSWVRLFGKIFYYSLSPLLVLLFVSIFTRLLEYGFTEARYFVLLLAIWLSVVTIYFAFFKKPTIKFIPISMFIFGIFALTFPFLNAFSVAKYSQKKSLMKILTENNLLKDGKINFYHPIKSELVNEIEDKFEFLDERHQRDYLMNLLPDDFPKANLVNEYRIWYLSDRFTHIEEADKQNNSYRQINLSNAKDLYEIKEYDYVFTIFGSMGDKYEKEIKLGNDNLTFMRAKGEFSLKLNNKETLDLLPQIKKFFKDKATSYKSYNVDDLSIENTLGKYKIKLIFESLNMSKGNKVDTYYYYDNILILIKKLD